jgi:hypothetical protein
MRLFLFLILICAPAAVQGAETPETILIRQTLDADKFGRRRGSAEMVNEIVAERFVSYDAQDNADPRSWKINHANASSYGQDVEASLKKERYDIERFVPFLHVRGLEAFVTTLDSGQVVDRQSGTTRPYTMRRLWFFSKAEDKWLATAVVENLGMAGQAGASQTPDPGVVTFLKEEESAWNNGNPGALSGLAAEGFVGYDGNDALAPAKWIILFSGNDEWESWLNRRLEHTSYKLERSVLSATTSSDGNEAVAVTRDQLSVSHAAGPATHTRQRHVLWTLSRRSGSWQVTNMLYNIGLDESETSN